MYVYACAKNIAPIKLLHNLCTLYMYIFAYSSPDTLTLYGSSVSSNVGAAVSQSSSIEWVDSEVVFVTGTRAVRSEGVVGPSNINTVSTGDGCGFICYIVDVNRVPDIRINIRHIQRIGSSP